MVTDAAEKIIRHFEESCVQFEEELHRQSRLLEIIADPQTRHQTLLLPHYFLRKQERNSSVKLENSEAPQIKGQQEELCSSQDVEQLDLNQETDILILTPTYEKNEDLNCQHRLTQSLNVTDDQNGEGNQHGKEKKKTQMKKLCRTKRVKEHCCEECEKSFTTAYQLRRHMRIHTGENLFSCKECGRCFTRSGSLSVHMKIHTGEKPFSCKECGRSFSRVDSLISHMRIHTGEKPFSCKECGKCFTLSCSLTDHMRIHTGEKPFPCKECGRSFRRSSKLSVHMRIHTGEKPFTCEECGRSFSHANSLTYHMRIHTEVNLSLLD